jgi:hypothetical protein
VKIDKYRTTENSEYTENEEIMDLESHLSGANFLFWKELRNHESDESNEWKKGKDGRLGIGELRVHGSKHFFGFVRFV